MRIQGLWAVVCLSAACGADPSDNGPSDGGLDLGGGTDMAADLGRDAGGPGTDQGTRDSGSMDAGTGDGGGPLQECSPALRVDPADAAVLQFSLYTIVPQGGTGAYRFEFSQNESGAIVNELTGAYLAGAEEGSVDVVRITDAGCLGETSVTIRVVEDLELRPSQATAPPGTSWTFETRGGSGSFRYELLLNNSGASLTEDGLYTAGSVAGTDRVQVVDVQTQDAAQALIQVRSGVSLQPVPPLALTTLEEPLPLRFVGGSGFVDVVGSASVFELEDGRVVVGRRAGRETVQVRDRFTGQTTGLTVVVAAPSQRDALRFGDGLFETTVRNLGDINGDGFADVAIAHPDADVDAFNGGAVFIYSGTAEGFDPEPVQIIAGARRSDELGRSFEVADFDGDGRSDLLIGAPRADVAGSDAGAVSIHLAQPGGWFSVLPDFLFTGVNGGDLLGWGVTACDFDGDGRVDVAAGAYNAEDRGRNPQSSNQGGVFVFRANENGFSVNPSRVVWGDDPDGSGGWTGRSDMHLGADLAGGDVNGDGRCDLVAASYEWDQNGNGNDGAVFVFLGQSDGAGVVAERPAIVWANLDPDNRGAQFGRSLAVADVDEDGKDDVLVGMYRSDHGNGDDHGALRLYRGRDFAGPAMAITPAVPADWQIESEGSFDWMGFSVRLADVDFDGYLDVVSGDPSEELPMHPGSSGAVRVYLGNPFNLPRTEPALEVGGVGAGDFFGSAVDVVEDKDGDGLADFVAFAHYNEDYGLDAGGAYFVSSDATKTLLDWPGGASGSLFGYRAAVVGDVTGDGAADLVVVAPHIANSELGRLTGAAFVYAGQPGGGFADRPSQVFEGFRQHSGFDYLGYGLAGLGDFDGDGLDDFAVVARFEDQPGDLSTPLDPEPDCSGSRSNVGAVFVFRGAASGQLSAQPAFIYYGPGVGDGIREVQGNFDFNGDGLKDMVVGGLDVDANGQFNNGVVALVAGRPADPSGAATRVICSADLELYGNRSNDQLGHRVAAIGDVNGDGCDESAAGAPFEDPVTNSEGGIRVLFGWGGPGCPAQPQMVALRSTVANAQGGYDLRGGGDVNLDGVPDLAVGLPNLTVNGNAVGAAGFIDGAYLATLPREPVQDASRPNVYHPFFDDDLTVSPIVFGTTPGELFGRSVAIVDWGSVRGIAAGIPNGDLGGAVLSGGAQAFAFFPDVGLVQSPVAAFGGEASAPGGLAGFWVQSRRVGTRTYLTVGAEYGSSQTTQDGSAYAFDITLP